MPQNKILPYDPKLKPLARKLRQSMTPGEVLLWQRLRKRALGYQFHRQVPIHEYIVDFFCHELMLVIEVDGSYHDHPQVSVSDGERQQELERLGVRFLRFEELEVRKHIERIVQTVEEWIALQHHEHERTPLRSNGETTPFDHLPSRGEGISVPNAP